MNCEQASTHVFTDNQGRAWEQFNLNNQGVFLNQIPDVQSFTRTNPGWVLADNGYCTWVGQPPARIRTEMPVLAPATVAPSTVPTAEADPGVAMGFMVLIALAGSAGFAYWKRQQEDKEIEKYDPHAHIPTDLPFSLSGGVKPQNQPEELWIDEGDPVPEGYTLVDEEDDDVVAPGKMSGVTEPSPWLRDQLPPLRLQPPTPTQAEPLVNQAVQPSEPPPSEPVNHFRTTPEPPTEPLTQTTQFEVVQGGLSENELTQERVKMLVNNSPYDLYQDRFKTLCHIRTAIDLGFSKNRTMKLFVHSKAVLNGLIETIPLSKGGGSAWVYFSELFSEAKDGLKEV